jgi:hypothetical protein
MDSSLENLRARVARLGSVSAPNFALVAVAALAQ